MESSLASLIESAKTNTARNALVQKTFAKRKNISTKESAPKKTKPDSRPLSDSKVVVFDDAGLKRQPDLDSKAAKRAFMSGKLWHSTETKTNEALPPEEIETEMENLRHDQELKALLATSKLLEEYQLENMSGKERRGKMISKLEELGAKPANKTKMPLEMHMGMEAKNREREMRRMQKAKDTGLYDKSLKHLYVSSKKPEKRDRDPGITNGIGRMKGGVLTISKRELSRLQNQNTKKKPTGGKAPFKGKKR